MVAFVNASSFINITRNYAFIAGLAKYKQINKLKTELEAWKSKFEIDNNGKKASVDDIMKNVEARKLFEELARLNK